MMRSRPMQPSHRGRNVASAADAKQWDVAALVAMNLDRVLYVSRLLTDGETPVRFCGEFPGGSAANTVYALAKLGARTAVVGAVGDDAEGRCLVRDLESVGVDASRVSVRLGERTSVVTAIIPRNAGDRALYVYPGANALISREELDTGVLSLARYVHLSSFVDRRQLELQKWIVRHLPSSTRLTFAPGSIYTQMGIAAIRPLIARAHVLFLNRAELDALIGGRIDVASDELIKLGAEVVVVSLGPREHRRPTRDESVTGPGWTPWTACYVRARDLDAPLRVPGRVTDVVDTVGAGDALAAGFISGLLHGETLERCAVMGVVTAANSLGARGARQGVPSAESLRRQLAALGMSVTSRNAARSAGQRGRDPVAELPPKPACFPEPLARKHRDAHGANATGATT